MLMSRQEMIAKINHIMHSLMLVVMNLHSEAKAIDFKYQNQYPQESFIDPSSRDHSAHMARNCPIL